MPKYLVTSKPSNKINISIRLYCCTFPNNWGLQQLALTIDTITE